MKRLFLLLVFTTLFACQDQSTTTGGNEDVPTQTRSFINEQNEPFFSINQYMQSIDNDNSLKDKTTSFSRGNTNYNVRGFTKPDRTVMKLIGQTITPTLSETITYYVQEDLPVHASALYKKYDCINEQTVCIEQVEHYFEAGRIIGSQMRTKRVSPEEAENPDLSNIPWMDYGPPRDSVWRAALNTFVDYSNKF